MDLCNYDTCMYVHVHVYMYILTYIIDNAGKMNERKLDMHSLHCSIFLARGYICT